MRVKVFIDNQEVTSRVILADTKLSKGLSNRSRQASLTIRATAQEEALYDIAKYDLAAYDWSISTRFLNSAVVIKDAATDEVIYRGFITRASVKEINPTAHLYLLEIEEFQKTLSDLIITSESYTNKNTKYIIEDLCSKYLPCDTTNVLSLATLPQYEIKDKPIAEVFSDLAKMVNGQWWLSPDNKLYFMSLLYAPPAPYKLTDDVSDPEYVKVTITDFQKDTSAFANRVTFLGGLQFDGTEIRVTVDNPASQASLGRVVEKVIVDREVSVEAIAQLLAQAELDKRVNPKITGSFETLVPGFDVGQSLRLKLEKYAVDDYVMITQVDYEWITADTVKYKVSFGPKPSVADLIQAIKKPVPQNTTIQSAVIPDGSITKEKIASVNASAIQGTIEGNNVNVNASVIQGTIQGSDVAVSASVIQGVILSSQLADEIIDNLQKYSYALRPIAIESSAPVLPNTAYPVGSYYYNSNSDTWWKNNNNVWQQVTEAEAINGKLKLYHVGAINAQNIIGLITAGQIGSVNANVITGNITANQSIFIAAERLTGNITAGQGVSINAGVLTGTISSSQNITIAAEKLTGTINGGSVTVNANALAGDITAGSSVTINGSVLVNGSVTADKIASINASQITGTIQANQIGTINASQITGTISASQIASINASQITGTIQGNQIGTINASQITGTISGSNITINGSTIINSTINADKITQVYADTVYSDTLRRFGPSWFSGDITVGNDKSIYVDNGNIQATNGVLRSAGLQITGNNFQINYPTEFRTALGAAAASHTHTFSDLSGVAPASHTHTFSDLSGVAPASHTHAISEITSLETALDGKASINHTHSGTNGQNGKYISLNVTKTTVNINGADIDIVTDVSVNDWTV
jgi:hypothetical protein